MKHMNRIQEFMKTISIIHRALPKSIFNTESGVTPLQLEALLYLHLHPKSKVSALGKYLRLSSSATAQLTDRLAKSGFIKRENNPQDRRSVILLLTPKGNKTFSQLHTLHAKKMKKLAALISEKDVKELTRIFGNFQEKLGAKKNG